MTEDNPPVPAPKNSGLQRFLAFAVKILVVGGAFSFLLVDWSTAQLHVNDIRLPDQISAALRSGNAKTSANPYKHLFGLLSAPCQESLLAAADANTPFVEAEILQREFNRIIVQDALYTAAAFADFPLPSKVTEQIAHSKNLPNSQYRATLNRQLFDILFPQAIQKRTGARLDLVVLKVPAENYHLIAGGVLLVLIAVVLGFFRYWIMLRGVDIHIPFREIIRIGFIGAFFNTFMLGTLGGDVIKVAYVMRETDNRVGAIASAMLDRVVGLLGMIALGGVVLYFSWPEVVKTPSLYPVALAIFGVLGAVGFVGVVSFVALAKGRAWGLGLWLTLSGGLALLSWYAMRGQPIIFPTLNTLKPTSPAQLRGWEILIMSIDTLVTLPCVLIVPSLQPGRRLAGFMTDRVPLGGKVMAFAHSILAYRNHFGVLVVAFLLSLVLQSFALFALYLYGLGIDLSAPPALAHIFFAAPPAFVAAALPIPGGGIGVGEAALEELLALCRNAEGVPIRGGAAIFLMNRCWTILLGLIGLVFYLRGKKEIEAARDSYLQEETAAGHDSAAG